MDTLSSDDFNPPPLSVDTDEFRRLVRKGRVCLESLQRVASDPAAQDKGMKMLQPYYWVNIAETVLRGTVAPIATGVHPAARLIVANLVDGQEMNEVNEPKEISLNDTSNAMTGYLYEHSRPRWT